MTTSTTDDGPKVELKLFADFKAEISSRLEKMNRYLATLSARADDSPHKYTLRSGGVVAANGTLLLPLGKPSLGREWILRHWSIVDPNNLNVSTTGTPAVAGTATAANSPFAAGAAGTVSLPTGSSITGFTVTSGAPGTPPVATTVTLTGAAGATNPTYNFEETANGGLLQQSFVPPLPPFSAGSTPTLSIAAAAGGAAGELNIFGVTAGTAAVPAAGALAGTAGLYTGSTDAFNSGNLEDWSSGNVMPFYERVTSESVWVIPQDALFVYVTGATPGQNLLAKARILDYPQWYAAQVQGV